MLPKRQRILYLVLANFVFLVHLALVLVVAIGWLVPGMYYVFLVLVFATLLVDIVLGYCPLTPLEFNLRRKLDPEKVYDKSCIMHYGRALFGLPPRVESFTPVSFFAKHSFKVILLGLIAAGTLTHLYYAEII